MKRIFRIMLSITLLLNMYVVNVCAETFTVKIEANGGSIHKIGDQNTKLEEMTLLDGNMNSNEVSLPDGYEAIRENYSFVGFKAKNNRGEFVDTAISNISNLENTLYAQWKGTKEVVVTLDPNGGNLDITSITIFNGDKYDSLPTPTRVGYSFVGWFTEVTGDNKIDTKSVNEHLSDHTLYAHWALNEYRVIFSNANPINSDKPFDPATHTIETRPEDRILPTIEDIAPREGFEFDGWYYKQEDKATTSIPYIATNVQYTAHWRPKNEESITYQEHNDSEVIEKISIIDVKPEDTKLLFSENNLAAIEKGYMSLGRKLIFDIYVSDSDGEGVKEEIAKELETEIEKVECVPFSIDLKVGGESLIGAFKQVDNTGLPLTFNVQLSAEQVKEIYGTNKNYFVMRRHEKTNTESKEYDYLILPASLQDNKDNTFTLSFSSEKFSVFALYSKDKPVVPTPANDDKPVKEYVAPITYVK